jgi:hypothetical protein
LSPNPTRLNPNPNPNTKPQLNPKPYPNTKTQPNPNPNFTNWEVAKEINVLLNVNIFFSTSNKLDVP